MSWPARDSCAEIGAAACLAALLIASSPSAAADRAAAPATTSLEVYGHLPTLEDVVLSPDGNRIAYVRTFGDERDLVVQQFGSAKALFAARVGEVKLRRIEWLDDDDLLTTVSSTSLPPVYFNGPKAEWWQLLHHRLSKQKSNGVEFRIDGERTFNVTTGTPMVRDLRGATTLFIPGLYVASRTLPGLFEYDVASGRMQLISKGSEPWTQWLVDGSGQIACEFLYHDARKLWELKAWRGDRLAVVASGYAPLDVPKVLGFSAKGDSIIVEFIENGTPVWRPFVLEQLDWGPPLQEGADFRAPIVDRKSGRIVGGVRGFDDDRYVFFNNELQARWNAVLRAFPNEQIQLVSASDGFGRIVVRVFGAKDGYVYVVFDGYTHQSLIFSKVYDGLAAVAEVHAIGYPAADGLSIPAYLTLPPGRSEGGARAPLPLIVLPHGGPQVADSAHFDWWAQALAVQGYAVLQPNYRGSALNERFMAAGYGQWGRKMQTDLSDGVRFLAAQGVIDPKRVCIVGASYGGYAALAGVALDPGVYRCAVSVAGISDLKRLFRWQSTAMLTGDSYQQRYWDRFMGLTDSSDPKLKEISPIEHIGAVSVPVLLIHGRDDTVVPYEQSEVMADALRHAGKPVQFVTLKREDHWLSRGATRLQMLEATVEFLKTNNPP